MLVVAADRVEAVEDCVDWVLTDVQEVELGPRTVTLSIGIPLAGGSPSLRMGTGTQLSCELRVEALLPSDEEDDDCGTVVNAEATVATMGVGDSMKDEGCEEGDLGAARRRPSQAGARETGGGIPRTGELSEPP